MRAAFEGAAWHGPAVLEVLRDVDPLMAVARPIAEAHSIWELVVHLTLTQDVLLRRIRGEEAGLSDSDFWADVPPPTGQNWADAMDRLTRQERELRAAVSEFPEDWLNRKLIPSGTHSAYANFHGHVQHNLYHAGQIALLKKAHKPISY